jgi:non-homologous end joining protein Ku
VPEEPAPAQVVDLMEALKASVAAASAKQADEPKKKAAPRKRATASK